jgi:hypothetical protein
MKKPMPTVQFSFHDSFHLSYTIFIHKINQILLGVTIIVMDRRIVVTTKLKYRSSSTSIDIQHESIITIITLHIFLAIATTLAGRPGPPFVMYNAQACASTCLTFSKM